MEFRTLRADEIECRVATVNPEKGLSLLLYKDARCDMSILDETVGAMNWMRSHSRDNANCTVSIWDAEKQQWISKEDTGTESNTEKEKGLASDSFKRACVNWGIGRELYTAPFIYVTADKVKWGKNRRGDIVPESKFRVTKIGCDLRNRINLLIINSGKGVVYEYYNDIENAQKPENKPKTTNKTNVPKEPQKEMVVCTKCGKPIKPKTGKDGKEWSAKEIFEAFGMCADCFKKAGEK